MSYVPTWKAPLASREICPRCHKMLKVKPNGSLPHHKCVQGNLEAER